MNILLIESFYKTYTLRRDDPRAEHILKILKMGVGDTLFMGVEQGPIFKAKITCINPNKELTLTFIEDSYQTPPPPFPITLILGLPRPQTARKILQQASTLGVQGFIFFQADKGDPHYIKSKLWTTNEWQRHIRAGAEQAFSTYIPRVEHFNSLEEVLQQRVYPSPLLALDVYESTESISKVPLPQQYSSQSIQLALGPEAGWSARERTLLKTHQSTLVHLGTRVLRQETACISAFSAIACRLGWI